MRVKNVEPGLVATELGDDMGDATGHEVLTNLRAKIESLRPEDIADAIAYAAAAPPRVNVALEIVPTTPG